jgi:acetylornithine deacetylase
MGLTPVLRDIDVEQMRGVPGWAPVMRSYRGRPNVTTTMAGTEGAERAARAEHAARAEAGPVADAAPAASPRNLVLNGHIDVVSPEPASWWSRNPWSGHVSGYVDGRRLYGRGAWDMKGGLVAALWALEAVRAAEIPLRGDVRFESVIEEECTGNGAVAARFGAPHADAAVIPECTSLEAIVSTPPVLWVRVTVRGRPAYVGRSGAYVNAVERATELIARLREIAAGPAGVGATLSVGTIDGGDWPSTVPLECSFTCRVSTPSDWTVERAKREVEAWVCAAAQPDPWLADAANTPTIDYPGFQAEAWSVDRSSPIVTALADAHSTVIGGSLSMIHFPGTTDARAFGARGEPAIVYGPSGGNQHAPDEYVDLDSVLLVARVLARLIVEWCA